jgi:enterochelin esterase family protein
MKILTSLLFSFLCAAQVHPIEQLIEAARKGPSDPELKVLLTKSHSPRVAVWGQDCLLLFQSKEPPAVSIDGQAPLSMQRVDGTNLWMRLERIATGATHSYEFFAGGKSVSKRSDLAGYNPESYPKEGVPAGTLSEKRTITSKIYPGMKSDYWVYAAPGVNPAVPSPLMVWQDGGGLANDNFMGARLFTVTENLLQRKLIPPMVYVLLSPGLTPDGKAMRSIEYDTVSDKYPRFLMEEVLPQVEKLYKLRPDGYSRGIAGGSSGGICAFNAAWFFPEKFSRVHSWVGSFASIQWHPEEKLDGGNIYPFKVRKEPKRNIRVWMSDGYDDLENDHGSWPLQNIQMANSLKMKEYDFHFRFGRATHGGAQMALDLPESLAWLWRGYDPARTSAEFAMDPAEKDKPYYRVTIANRDAW